MTGRDAHDIARVDRALAFRAWAAFAAGAIALAAVLGLSGDAATQGPATTGPLVATDPEPNALLATAPDRISLTFAAPIDLESASVRLLRVGGVEAPLGPVQGDDAGQTRISARPERALGAGDYTVVWSARGAGDRELLSGAYPFRTGVVTIPGAAPADGAWPEPWATIPRWLVFLGTSLAAGGFAWSRPLAPRASGARARPIRTGVMALGALVALTATALPVFLTRILAPASDPLPTLTGSLRAMPPGWWVQLVALVVLALLCLGILASGRTAARLPVALDWLGLGAGLVALVGLSLTSHAYGQSPLAGGGLALEIAHQWSTALWLSGLLYLAAGWRGLGSDVARFRSVRWIGGALFAVSVLSGLAGAGLLFPSFGDFLSSRYGQVLAAKGVIVLVILALGLLAMVVPRRSTAARASRSLGVQARLAVLAVFVAAVLALMSVPGTVVPATLAGVALADVVPVDRAAFAAPSATVHLLTQPAMPGPQTLVVRLTDGRGQTLAPDPAPEVEVTWTPFATGPGSDEPVTATAILDSDTSGAFFTGVTVLPLAGWWQADVIVTPPGGIASRARFWLVLPDPNIAGRGPDPASDPEAQAVFERGLASLTSLRSVRYAQQLGDGAGTLYRSQTAVSAAEGERPAAYVETVIDAAGGVVAQQTIVGDRRWIRVDDDWVEAEPIPFLTPAAWGEAYAGATGFQLGPREAVDGELSQVITFRQPPRADPSRAPAWFAWWIGLASGEVRREAMVSTRHYMVYGYSDFDAPLGITPPIAAPPPAATPARPVATPVATPAARDQVVTP